MITNRKCILFYIVVFYFILTYLCVTVNAKSHIRSFVKRDAKKRIELPVKIPNKAVTITKPRTKSQIKSFTNKKSNNQNETGFYHVGTPFVGVPVTTTTSTHTVSNPVFTVKDPSDYQDDIMQYAPVLKFHPRERYFPSSVDFYLPYVRLRYNRSWASDRQYIDYFEVNQNNLISQNYMGRRSGGIYPTEFFLETNDVAKVFVRRGFIDHLWDVPIYIHFRRSPSRRYYDIQYWFFYPYNGNISEIGNFAHEGDWEHITVRVTRDFTRIKKVFYAAHDKQGKWYSPNEIELVDGTHPVVYVAKFTHASYPLCAGIRTNDGGSEYTDYKIPMTYDGLYMPDDHISPDGEIWMSFDKCIQVGEPDAPLNNQLWLKYNGRWGEIGQFSFTSGPIGPAVKFSWDDDNEEILNGKIIFYEGNNCRQDIVGYTSHEPGQVLRLKKLGGWDNDEIRSVELNGVRAGTIIKVYGNPNGRRNEGWAKILVKRKVIICHIGTFERSYEDNYIRMRYFGDDDLDGKISRIEIDSQ